VETEINSEQAGGNRLYSLSSLYILERSCFLGITEWNLCESKDYPCIDIYIDYQVHG